jgi:hypothetical protein
MMRMPTGSEEVHIAEDEHLRVAVIEWNAIRQRSA